MLCTYVIKNEIVKYKLLQRIMKKNCKEFRVEKVIKRKDDKLYVKWKGYDDLFNRWFDKEDIAR